MKQIRLTFGTPRNVTPPGMDGTVIRFPFTAVDADLVGAPEEEQNTTSHRLKITISRWQSVQWKAKSDTDIVKVMFEVGKRQLVKSLAAGNPLTDEFAPPMISYVPKSKLPFDPDRLDWPDGLTCIVEMRPKIGFTHVA
jgi:hypothetical protein